MAKRDCASVGVDLRRVVGKAELTQHGERLRCKRLVQLDRVDRLKRPTDAVEQLACRWNWAHAHDARRDPSAACADDTGSRSEPPAPYRIVGGDQQRTGAVVDARGIAGGDAAAGSYHRAKFSQIINGRVATGVLVARHHDRITLGAPHRNRHDLAVEKTGLLRRQTTLLGAQCERILIVAGNVEFGGNVLRSLGHRVNPVLRLNGRVDETPADGRVLDARAARISGLRFAYHEWRTRHAFDSASDDQIRFAAADRARRLRHCFQPGGAESVHRAARNIDRQAREQPDHAGDVTVVLAGLVSAAVEQFVCSAPVDASMSPDQRAHRNGAEVVGAHGSQHAAIAAKRGAYSVDDPGLALM